MTMPEGLGRWSQVGRERNASGGSRGHPERAQVEKATRESDEGNADGEMEWKVRRRSERRRKRKMEGLVRRRSARRRRRKRKNERG